MTNLMRHKLNGCKFSFCAIVNGTKSYALYNNTKIIYSQAGAYQGKELWIVLAGEEHKEAWMNVKVGNSKPQKGPSSK